jgi:hypothetical protein
MCRLLYSAQRVPFTEARLANNPPHMTREEIATFVSARPIQELFILLEYVAAEFDHYYQEGVIWSEAERTRMKRAAADISARAEPCTVSY